MRDRASHVLVQGGIRLVLTGSLRPGGEIGEHHARHGDGVRDIALSVPDAAHAYRTALERGARGVREPWAAEDEDGVVRMATIAAYGDTRAHLRRARRLRRRVPPRLRRPPRSRRPPATAGCIAVDHVVGNVELGEMETWVRFYEDVFGMTEMLHFSDEAISTEYSALMSKVVSSGDGRIKFPINEPAEGRRRSQIDEYLEFYGGAGAQHIAVATRDIVRTVDALQRRGIAFLRTPDAYYDELPGAHRRDRRGPRGPAPAGHPRRPRRRGLPAAGVHQAGGRPADAVLRGHRAPRRALVRGGELQGAVRGDRARAGAARQPLTAEVRRLLPRQAGGTAEL